MIGTPGRVENEPDETWQEIESTARLVKKIHPDVLTITITTPLTLLSSQTWAPATGVLVTVNPFRVKLRATATELRIQAKGYEPYVASVVPTADQEIAVSLAPKK